MRGLRIVPFAVVATLGLWQSACQHLLRERTTPFPEALPDKPPWGLNREFLLTGGRRILFVADAHPKARPSERALRRLAEVASRYCECQADWVRLGERGVPRFLRTSSGSIRCEGEPPDPPSIYVLVTYVDDLGGHYGATRIVETEGQCNEGGLFEILISKNKIGKAAFLWLTRTRLEERVLVHEYGHVLGLGTNPAHSYLVGFPSKAPHCVRPDCAMSVPRWRSLAFTAYFTGLTFRNIADYCRLCRRDIYEAKSYWAASQASPSKAEFRLGLTEVVALGFSVDTLIGKAVADIVSRLDPQRFALATTDEELPEGWPKEIIAVDQERGVVRWYYQASTGEWRFFDGRPSYEDTTAGRIRRAYIFTRRPIATSGVSVRPVVRITLDASGRCTEASYEDVDAMMRRTLREDLR